jgi:hypothetical protein
MLEQLLDLLKIAGILLVFITAWLISIAVVFRDINRRSLNGLEQFLWLAAVALLPLIGFLIYWVARLLTRLLLSDPRPPEDPRLRLTAVKPAPNNFPRAPLYQGPRQEPIHKSTIPAAQPPMPAQPVSQQLYPPQARSQPPYPAHSYTGHAGYALVATEGPYMGGKFLITQFPARIGRGNSVTVQLNSDQGVSRQHAEIYTEPNGQPHIRDLNSTHGTYVNGRRIIDSHLSPGDRVTLGQSTFVFSEHRG